MTINDLENQDVVIVNGIDGNPIKIASGTSLSQAIDLKGFDPYAVLFPAAWTSAALNFQLSFDGGVTFVDDISGVTVPNPGAIVPCCEHLQTPGGNVSPIPLTRFIKLRSGTGGTPVNQAADRLFSIVCGPSMRRVQV